MAAFICRTCKAETNKLIYPVGYEETVCPNCYQVKNVSNINLHLVSDSWEDKNGKKRRITEGKRWEIEHRTISKDDGVTVINDWTKKEAQY